MKIKQYNDTIGYETILKLFSAGQTLHKGRNLTKRIECALDGRPANLCVKKFKTPPVALGWYYARTKSKAWKSYENAMQLKQSGIGVPEPVNCINVIRGNRLTESYYIDVFQNNCTDLRNEMAGLAQNGNDADCYPELLQPVAEALRKLHDAGFLCNDIGSQNTLIRKLAPGKWGDVRFIDLNRGRFYKRISRRLRAKDLARLDAPPDFRTTFLKMYFRDDTITAWFRLCHRIYRVVRKAHCKTHRMRHPLKTLLEYRQQNL